MLWKSQDVTLGGEAHHNWYFTVDGDAGTPWPEWKGDIYVRYNFRERIVASVDFNFQSSYEAAGITVPSVADLSLNLNYRISEPFSLFIKCGNIFNRVNAYIPSYPSPGVNFGGGFTLSL